MENDNPIHRNITSAVCKSDLDSDRVDLPKFYTLLATVAYASSQILREGRLPFHRRNFLKFARGVSIEPQGKLALILAPPDGAFDAKPDKIRQIP